MNIGKPQFAHFSHSSSDSGNDLDEDEMKQTAIDCRLIVKR
jgi:hypothetical protein